MKKFVTLAMAAFLVVSSTGFALAQDPAPAKEPVLRGDGSVYVEMAAAAATVAEDPCFVGVDGVNCPAGDQNVIAFDTSNGAWPAVNGNHCELIKDLKASGYNVRTFDLTPWGDPGDTNPDWTPWIGPCVDTVVITSLAYGGCNMWPYEQDQIDLIKARVDAGLGLLLLNEYGPACGVGTAPIAAAFGAPWNANGQEAQYTFAAGTHYQQDSPASLFWDVSSWGGWAFTDYNTTEGVVARNNNLEPVMIAKPVFDGCVVITGDTNWATDDWIGYGNNLQLARNAFGYLEFCGQLAPDPDRWLRGRGNIKSPVVAAAGAAPPGEASFDFVAKYKKVLSALEGNASFADEAFYDGAGLTFESTSVTRLATGGNMAKFEGTGTINGTGNYRFIIWTSDGDPDTFRIKIVDAVTLEEEYDSGIQDLTKGGIAMHGKE